MDREIFAGEPIRYPEVSRRGSNNGFRRRWLANGARHAAAVNAARRGDTSAALAVVIGADGQPKTFAKALLKLAKKLPADIPPYRVDEGKLWIPSLEWGFRNGFHKPRTLRLHWLPCWGIETAKAA